MRISTVPEGFPARIVRARDGDTIVCDVELGFDVSIRLAVRLVNIEAAEPIGETKRRAAEDAAKIFGRWHGVECVLVPSTRGRDCYGRARGDIITNEGSLSEWLISHGIAWRVPSPKSQARAAAALTLPKEVPAVLLPPTTPPPGAPSEEPC